MIDPREDSEFEYVMAAMDKANLSQDGKLEMFKDRRFGIDWGTGPTSAPDAQDADDWKASLKQMRKLCRDGGLVFMPCQNTDGVESGLLGQVDPPADIEIRSYDSESGEGEVEMKTLKLRGVREVHPDDDTEIFDINYSQWTVHNIKKHRDTVVEAYEQVY